MDYGINQTISALFFEIISRHFTLQHDHMRFLNFLHLAVRAIVSPPSQQLFKNMDSCSTSTCLLFFFTKAFLMNQSHTLISNKCQTDFPSLKSAKKIIKSSNM